MAVRSRSSDLGKALLSHAAKGCGSFVSSRGMASGHGLDPAQSALQQQVSRTACGSRCASALRRRLRGTTLLGVWASKGTLVVAAAVSAVLVVECYDGLSIGACSRRRQVPPPRHPGCHPPPAPHSCPTRPNVEASRVLLVSPPALTAS